jgi:hypothetical protein
MLIVKTLFSFYVEFEILLYFLLFCRLWNVNKDINMRNNAWNEIDRTYTKKSSEKHFWTKIADHNYGIFSLIRSVKKVQKLRTAIITARSANLQFWSGFLIGIKKIQHPFVPNISQLTGEDIPSKKEDEEHYFLYSFLMLCCCLNRNLCAIFDMICS